MGWQPGFTLQPFRQFDRLVGYLLISKKERSAGASSVSYEGAKKFQIKGPACIMLIGGGMVIAVVDVSLHGGGLATQASLSARSIVHAAEKSYNKKTADPFEFMNSFAERRLLLLMQQELEELMIGQRVEIDNVRKGTSNSELRMLLDELTKITYDVSNFNSVDELRKQSYKTLQIEFRNKEKINKWSETTLVQ